jgi:hypothetical protein
VSTSNTGGPQDARFFIAKKWMEYKTRGQKIQQSMSIEKILEAYWTLTMLMFSDWGIISSTANVS